MITTHAYKAAYIEGRGIVVTDESGAEVKVSYGATQDTTTCYAYTQAGFIGGWQCAPKSARMHFRQLVEFINRRRLYSSMDELPVGRKYAKRSIRYSQEVIS